MRIVAGTRTRTLRRPDLDSRLRGNDRASDAARPYPVTCTPFQKATRSLTISASGFGSG